jgi:hypothetical protein
MRNIRTKAALLIVTGVGASFLSLAPAARADACLPVSTDPVLTCNINSGCVSGQVIHKSYYRINCS